MTHRPTCRQQVLLCSYPKVYLRAGRVSRTPVVFVDSLHLSIKRQHFGSQLQRRVELHALYHLSSGHCSRGMFVERSVWGLGHTAVLTYITVNSTFPLKKGVRGSNTRRNVCRFDSQDLCTVPVFFRTGSYHLECLEHVTHYPRYVACIALHCVVVFLVEAMLLAREEG